MGLIIQHVCLPKSTIPKAEPGPATLMGSLLFVPPQDCGSQQCFAVLNSALLLLLLSTSTTSADSFTAFVSAERCGALPARASPSDAVGAVAFGTHS